MSPFPFNENRFSFFVADHLLVGQLCTHSKSDRSLLSCPLPIQIMTTGQLPAPSKCKSGRFNAWGHSLKHRTTLRTATVMVFAVVSSEGNIMPPHIFEVGLKVNTKVYLDVLKSVVIPLVQSGGRWQTLGVVPGLGAGPQVHSDPGFASEGVLRLCTLISLAPSSPDLNPLDYFVWSYVENITNMTFHNTKASLIAAIRRVFAELPRCLWKRHAPSSGSISRRWLRLKDWIDVSSTTLSSYLNWFFSVKV